VEIVSLELHKCSVLEVNTDKGNNGEWVGGVVAPIIEDHPQTAYCLPHLTFTPTDLKMLIVKFL